MDPLEYERVRKSAATELGIDRVTVLDEEVKRRRTTLAQPARHQGRELKITDAEPWPEPVDGGQLIDAIVAGIQRHVILSEPAAFASALWVIHSYALDYAEHSPRLHLSSPVWRCGKSTMLKALQCMVRRPLKAENISTAVFFRAIEATQPTLLIDEVDSFLKRDSDMIGLLNAGHERDGAVLRSVGDAHEPCQFAVYGAVALAGIGKCLPEPTLDRSIIVAMSRRLKTEIVERLDRRAREALIDFGRKAARWVKDNAEKLCDADPKLPEPLSDRAQDNWRPFIAIADAAGGDSGKKAREAAVKLSDSAAEDTDDMKVLLLGDIWKPVRTR